MTPTTATLPRPRPRPARSEPHRWSFRVGRLLGVEIRIHLTFFLLVGWVALDFLLHGRGLAASARGLVLLAGIFASVVLHELGHALVARRFGIATRDITLLPIGGISTLEHMPERPRQELAMALAGPLVNGALALALFAAAELARLPEPVPGPTFAAAPLVASLLWANVSLGLFNLLPAFPMDGGRVLRAALALRMGRERATAIAARLSRWLALALILFGLVASPMLALIGLFVWLGGSAEAAEVQRQATFAQLRARDAMVRRFSTLSPRDPLARAVELMVAERQEDFPVVEGSAVVGVLSRDDLLAALASGGPATPVGEAMTPEYVPAGLLEPVSAVLDRLREQGARVALVMDGGALAGMLTPRGAAQRAALDRLAAPPGA